MSYQHEDDDHLAYGEYHGLDTTDGQGGSRRGFLSDALGRLRTSPSSLSSSPGVDLHEQHDDAALAVSDRLS